MQPIPLGAFQLHELIGEGGMGQVYRAVHAPTGAQVAVKLITPDRFRDSASLEHFEGEVRAFARLNHPAIVLVYDHGLVDATAAEASFGQLVEGSPYLVMELSTGGTLNERLPRSWAETSAVVRRLLDALAHAHARGVVHRDLKLSNVLVAGPGDVRSGLKLSDFGAAHDLDVDESLPDELIMVGTPAYIPPEQILGRWRDFGPWTDLYALGIATWVMVTGEFPFVHENLHGLLGMHVRVPPPPLTPTFEVPDELEGWLRRLLEKDPTDRFRRAADAAWALEQFSSSADTTQELGPVAVAELIGEGTQALEQLTGMLADEATRPVPPSLVAVRIAQGHDVSPAPVVPPLPDTWRRRDSEPAALQLGGAGLGLYGLRTHPLIGREEERDEIWSALGEVVAGGGPRLVALEGYSGLGKSHLAHWIAERAHELGNATVLPVYHGPIPGKLPPLLRMVEGYFGVNRMDAPAARERIAWALARHGVRDDYEADALTELLRPGARHGGSAVHFSSPAERYDLIDRVISRQSRRRPVLLLIEDVQWGLDALSFVAHLMSRRRAEPLRVLVLATMRQRIGQARTPEAQQLEQLLDRPDARLMDIGLLPDADVLALVQDLLGLSGELAHELAARADGGPLFAVQLVTDWIQRGLLVPDVRGFRLKAGARTDLPDDIHQLWADLLDRILSGYPRRARVGLELAAALGRQVDDREWAALCARQGIRVPTRMRDALIARNLAVRFEGGWAFVHGLLQESVERSAREAGRLQDHHRLCVGLLRDAGAPPGRLGRHLLAAGELRDAIDSLLAAATRAWALDDYRAAADLLTRRERAMERIAFVVDDPRWGHGWVLRGLVLWRMGDLPDAEAILWRAEQAAERHGWADVQARALDVKARIARYRGNTEEGLALATRALEIAAPVGHPRLVAGAQRVLGRMLVDRVRFDEARELLAEARTTFEGLHDLPGVIDCERTLYSIARQQGDLVEARRIAETLRGIQELRGHRWGLGLALESLGEVARHSGELAEAEDFYRQAQAMFLAVSQTDPRAHASTINLALTLMAQRRFEEADDLLSEAAQALKRHDSRALYGVALCMLAACAAGRGRWSSFDSYLERGAAILRPIGLADIDLAIAAMQTAERAEEAGEHERARMVLGLALEQYELLGREADAAAVRARLES